jgi:hypothetical protein
MKIVQFVVPAFLLVASGAVSAGPVINPAPFYTVLNTAPFWNGTDFVSDFGNRDGIAGDIVLSFGQTITVSRDNVLDSFSFYMDLPPSLTFSGYVFRWNGSSATGPELFKSVTTATKGGFVYPPRYEHITFDTGGLALTAGQYVLFASAAEYPPVIGFGLWGAIYSDVYSGGEAAITFGTDLSQWTGTEPWFPYLNGGDFAFDATFAVPEPSAFIVLTGALFSLTLFRRRRIGDESLDNLNNSPGPLHSDFQCH